VQPAQIRWHGDGQARSSSATRMTYRCVAISDAVLPAAVGELVMQYLVLMQSFREFPSR
jgi:hypothetical protein